MKPESPGHGAWIAVCDGAKAMILENTGSAAESNLKLHEVLTHHSLPTHLQGSDVPGRAFGLGGRRAAVAQADFHTREEDAFITGFAAVLEERLRDHEVQGLFLVAPPHALGVLRAALGETARKLLRGELTRDYAGLTVPGIEEHFRRFYGQAS